MNDNSSSAIRELQNLRLMQAFLRIHDQTHRLALLQVVEALAGPALDQRSHGSLGPQDVPSPATFPENPA
ncbi:hypothetical protein [Bradyrhizobium iriomotense]|uniref:Uncharacterized protein n=1 Tax=Bradyrhizobium iriomotense TaxID=441950 RepID=A0ABQ6BBV1_9BRAD|nr:hypothetical protein [Bradyrhizobium iriomotense]GLR91857.1 hypothetical protein GCM10007857_85750 [Bradyrhizobium iriomotense]